MSKEQFWKFRSRASLKPATAPSHRSLAAIGSDKATKIIE
jgi:hypothetical protein